MWRHLMAATQPVKIQQKSDKYGCIYSVQLVEVVDLPVSTPKPEVEFYLSGIG